MLIAGIGIGVGATLADVLDGHPTTQDRHWCAGLIAIEALLLFMLVLWSLRTPLQDLVLGKDKRLSTSKLQALLWTLTLGGVLLAIVVADWLGAGEGLVELNKAGLPEEYLVLLGGPFAAAVASRAIVGAKVEKGSLTKTEGETDAKPGKRLSEAVSDDHGNTNLVDTQYLLFNLVALIYVIGGFVDNPNGGVPQIPDVLVALTAASAATYVSNKAVQGTTPVLSSVLPARAAVNTPVRVLGRNLLTPAGDNAFHEVHVMFDKEVAEVVGLRKAGKRLVPDDGDADHLPDHEDSGDDEFWVTVPETATLGAVRVTAQNFKGVAAKEKVEFEVLAGDGSAGG